jgi:hypothetical protein
LITNGRTVSLPLIVRPGALAPSIVSGLPIVSSAEVSQPGYP